MDPIIIVSPSSSALITMHNIKQFLEDGHFTPVQPNAQRSEDVVSVLHKRHMGGNAAAQAAAVAAAQGKRLSSSSGGVRTARYLVVDSVEALTKFGDDAWDRVVCVFTTGQEWQFAPYKWPEPKELFHHGAQDALVFLDDLPMLCRSQRRLFSVQQRAHQRQGQGVERHHAQGACPSPLLPR
jgi:parafibromin